MRQVLKIRCVRTLLSLMVAAGYVAAVSPEVVLAAEQSVPEAKDLSQNHDESLPRAENSCGGTGFGIGSKDLSQIHDESLPRAENCRGGTGFGIGSKTVVARVNSQPIYEEQLKPQVDKALSTFRKYGMQKDDPGLVKRLQAKALDEVIGNLLVNQEAMKRTIEDIDKKIEEKVKVLERKYGAGPGMERYVQLRRISMDDLKESLKTRVCIDEYLKEQGILEPEIPEERIRAMYNADSGSFSSKEAVSVSHILLKVAPHAGDEEKEQARKKAVHIRKEVLEGKDFAEAAKEHSDCNSAPGGGNLGRIEKGFMPAEFDKVAFAMEKNALSDIVETKFGYHIIKVTDKYPAGLVPYEQMRGFLKKYLQEEESKKKLASHIAELREKSEIEILLK